METQQGFDKQCYGALLWEVHRNQACTSNQTIPDTAAAAVPACVAHVHWPFVQVSQLGQKVDRGQHSLHGQGVVMAPRSDGQECNEEEHTASNPGMCVI